MGLMSSGSCVKATRFLSKLISTWAKATGFWAFTQTWKPNSGGRLIWVGKSEKLAVFVPALLVYEVCSGSLRTITNSVNKETSTENKRRNFRRSTLLVSFSKWTGCISFTLCRKDRHLLNCRIKRYLLSSANRVLRKTVEFGKGGTVK